MMALTKADMLENLSLLIQQLSRVESVDQTLQNLLNLAQEDLVSLAFVNYVNRYIQEAGDKIALEDLRIFIDVYCQSLQQEAGDGDQILKKIIHQADQLEQKTSIYPTAHDGFENSGELCATKLDELLVVYQSGEDRSNVVQEAKKMAASFGMLRLLAYLERLEDGDIQQVKTLLLQGQEYRIGASEELGELLESTTLSATAKDWGVEEFLVNPLPPQDSEDDIISFIDQEDSFAPNDTFNSLFDEEESSEGIKIDLFDRELAEEQPETDREEDLFAPNDTFNSLFDEEESSEYIKTDPSEADQISVNLDTEQRSIDLGLLDEELQISQTDFPDFEAQSGSSDINVIEEEQLFNLNDPQSEVIQGDQHELSSQDDVDIDPSSGVSSSESYGFSLFEEEEESNLGELPIGIGTQLINDLEESSEHYTEEQLILSEDSPEEVTDSGIELELFSEKDSLEEEYSFESKDDQIEMITDERDVFNIDDPLESIDLHQNIIEAVGEDENLGEELRLEHIPQVFDENDDEQIPLGSEQLINSNVEEIFHSLSTEERQDVTEILGTFSVVTRRTNLNDLGLLELVEEAIGDFHEKINFDQLLGFESTVKEQQEETAYFEPEITVIQEDTSNDDVSSIEDPLEQVDAIPENLINETLTSDELSTSVELINSEQEEDLTILQGVPEFFGSIDLESSTSEDEENVLNILDSSVEEEPIVDEEDFSFLEESPVIEEVSTSEEEPIVVEEDFSFLEENPVFEEVFIEEEPIVDEQEEDMTIFQDVPVFFEDIEDNNEVQQGEMSEVTDVSDVSIDDLLADLSQPISTLEGLSDEKQQDDDDQIDSLLSEISNSIPSSNPNLEEDNTTVQEIPEFFSSINDQAEEVDASEELNEFLSRLDQNDFNIRQYDQDTEVVNFEAFIEEGESLENEPKSFTEDTQKNQDATEELSKLLGDMSDEDLEELANTFSQEDGDDSGFFFFQGNEGQIDDDSEISLIELFNGDRTSENPDDVLEELEEFLEDEMNMVNTNPATSEIDNSFDELEALLADDASQITDSSDIDELESLLSQTTTTVSKKEDFADLDALLGSMPSSKVEVKIKNVAQNKTALNIAPPPGPTTRSTMAQNMRVDVRYLDNINNLVGELIVNRNLLQQDQIRLQTSLGNLFSQIHKLNDVAQRVRDEFDRSLLERSLQATLDHSYLDFSESGSGQVKTIRVKNKDTNSGDALTRLDEHDELNNLALDIIELITRVKESASDVEFVIDETQQVSRQLGTITTQIEDDLKQVRMEPFSEISDRLPKQVRDLALKRKKQADIEISGRETMIDKAILQGLNTPINHLITNALVHGIEDPEVRISAGKDPVGKLTVKAYHQGNETIISITDDGGGINPEKVRQSAISKGLLTVAEARLLSDQDTYSLLFRAGFSTKAEVDEEGGRGVGLDAVITQLNSIKGSIQVESAIGKGSTFTIRLPLTLSISKAMVCLCNRNRVAFPVDSFEDVVEITQDQVFVNSNGQTCFLWREMELPFRPLGEMLTYNRQIGRLGFIKQDDDIISIIVLRSERNFLALQVDKFDGEIEIVIKQVEGPVAKPPGIAGVTVLGDGRVMAICNVLELFGIASGTINVVEHDLSLTETEDQEKATTVLVVDDSVTMRKALVQTFEKAGYRVEEARNGKEAWDKLRGGLFCDLIFSDVEMPQMNGFQLLEKLQKDEELSRIPVAMLTSQGKRVHIENAANLGAKAYFVKAYTDQEVLEGAERLLRGQVAGKILEII